MESSRRLCSCVWNVNVGKARWIYVIYREIRSLAATGDAVHGKSLQKSKAFWRAKEKETSCFISADMYVDLV